MRAHEYLFEDNRSKIKKLRELVDHPSTEETIRRVAISKLKILLTDQPQSVITMMMVETNITEADLDRPFVANVSLKQLYEGLCGLSPSPNNIQFLRQGQIQMIVPPPFMGKTKNQYVAEVHAACPGSRRVSSRMLEGRGYLFLISYI